MIKTKPILEREIVEKLLTQYGFDKDKNFTVLELWDSDVQAGFLVLSIVDDTVYFDKFILVKEYSELERIFFVDFLMRSGASYAENRGIENMVNMDSEVAELLIKKGFKKEDDKVFAPVSLVVHYH